MRSRTLTSSAGALLLFAATVVNGKHGVHERLETLHRKHQHHHDHGQSTAEVGEEAVELRYVAPETAVSKPELRKRGTCQFPTDAGLVAVTSGDENGGWAMSPNQPCTPGSYCPYACPAGQVSVQWDPTATSYSYPKSMNGGLYCGEDGTISKPFPGKPYCQSTSAVIGVQNNAGAVVAFCQTVLPGNEAMLIPTAVESWTQLAIPDTSYWCGTAAHYYINSPGTSTDTACVWGTAANPWGNWAPYVAGGNTDGSGNTFIKLGWNPIWLEPATPFRNTVPDWGVAIQCDGEGCNGLPCAIDPTRNGVNEMVGAASDGAGGAAFCVVTVPQGVTANFVITNAGGSNSASPSPQSSSTSSESSSQWSQSQWSSSSYPTFTAAQDKAGQFYQSATTSSAASTQTTTYSVASSWSAATSSASYSNTTHTWKPTGSPYYSLFNHTSPATSTLSGTLAAATASVTAPSVAPSQTSIGAASGLALPAFGFLASFVVAAFGALA